MLLIASYYLLFIFGASLGRHGTLPVSAGIWIANLTLGVLGLILLPRMEQLRGDSIWLSTFARWRSWARLLRRRKAARSREVAAARVQNGDREIEVQYQQSNSFPRLMDLYILRRFLSYFLLLMVMFIFLFETFSQLTFGVL